MSLDWPRFSGPLREPVDEDRAQQIADEKAHNEMNIMKNDDKTPTEWVQQFHPLGQTRDCIHGTLARNCVVCGLEKELFYSQRENAELCAFINREMKMTGSDPRIAAIVKHIADAATPTPMIRSLRVNPNIPPKNDRPPGPPNPPKPPSNREVATTTPRTDAFFDEPSHTPSTQWAHFARQLERELAEATKDPSGWRLAYAEALAKADLREQKLVEALEEISKRFPGNQKPGNV
jgi:hypothetical protein